MEDTITNFSIAAQFGGIENTIFPTILSDSKNHILVDCGFIGSLPALEKELTQRGFSVTELTGLVLTHHDHDHMGTAAAIKRKNPKIVVYASAEEAPFISAHVKPFRLHQAEEMQASLPAEQQDFGKAFCDMLRRVEPVEADVLLQDGDHFDWCGGCSVLSTPGHTPGHISLFMEKVSIVLTGDAITLEHGKPVLANPQFAFDLKKATASMERLLSIHAKTYYCYHGGVFTPEGS